MVNKSSRDRAWLAVIEALRNGRDTRTRIISENAGVSMATARRVLLVCEEAGLFHRLGECDKKYRVDIGLLGEVDDDEYCRMVRLAVRESE